MADLLTKSIDAVVISHDLIKTFFLENGIFFDQASKLTYRFHWILAEDMIKQGRSVIIDSTCNFDETLDQGTALARQYGYDYKYVEHKVNDINLLDQTIRSRALMRSQRRDVNHPPPDADDTLHGEDRRALCKGWIKSPYCPANNTIIVNSAGSPEECLDYIMKWIITPAVNQQGIGKS